MDDSTSRLFILKRKYSVLELEEKYEGIKRFMLDVLEDACWKKVLRQICQKTNDTC